MLSKKSVETYYAISICYNENGKSLITAITETDGDDFFDFSASYEKNIDKDTLALIKKFKSYSFSANELSILTDQLADLSNASIKSILTENNLSIEDIDFICIEGLSLKDSYQVNISTQILLEFNTPVIFNLETDTPEFLKVLANNRPLNNGIIVNLDDNFDIYQLANNATLLETDFGYNTLKYLSLYFNLKPDDISYLISQGDIDMSVINQLKNIEDASFLQKELVNNLVFSKIKIEDKLATAFYFIANNLLNNLSKFDSSTNIMLIGNTRLVEKLNQDLKQVFENVVFLKNQSQRQNTLKNEQLAYFAAKKYTVKNYNNGVKIS